MSSLFEELKRRNVFKVGTAYLVLAWVVIQVVDVAVPALRLPEWVNSLVFLLGAIGFPFALFFAWAFEITPDGIKKESEVDRSQSISDQTGRKIDFIIIGLLAIGLIYFFFESRILDRAEPETELTNTETSSALNSSDQSTSSSTDTSSSIAVLPFVNMSSDAEQEYFSDGISEEILNVLAQIPQLKVTSRSSAFAFKGKEINISEVAKVLGVAHILEGSVRTSGKRIRITAQLIEAETDSHLWSETYDRELNDIFAIQDEISNAIVNALKDKLNIDDLVLTSVSSTINEEAHNQYLLGRFDVIKRSEASAKKALKHFEQAIEIDPNYAIAYTGVAQSYVYLAEYSYGDIPMVVANAKVLEAVNKALSLEPLLPEAHALLAIAKANIDPKLNVSEHFEKAIELRPNYADAYTWYGDSLTWRSHVLDYTSVDKVEQLFSKAVLLDPLSMVANVNQYYILAAKGEHQRSKTALDSMLEIEPNHLFTQFALATYSKVTGNYSESIFHQNRTLSQSPKSLYIIYNLATSLSELGLDQQAGELFTESSLPELKYLYQQNPELFVSQVNAKYPRYEDDFLGHLLLAKAAIIKQDFKQAIEEFKSSFICDLCDDLIYSYLQAGDQQQVLQMLEIREQRYQRLVEAGHKLWIFNPPNYSLESPFYNGLLHTEVVAMNNELFRNNIDKAIAHLEAAMNDGFLISLKLKTHDMYQPIRAHQRWPALLAKAESIAAKHRKLYLANSSVKQVQNNTTWKTDFFDDFDNFNADNWQDQILWVNDEDQCYVRDNELNTREVSNGTLKLRVIDLGEPRPCDNLNKYGKQHPPTEYIAGRIASKNLKEFSRGRWTARLRLSSSGESGMFPAWWLLGYRNNEPPVQEANENICWPAPGSGEIDIFEHHSDGGANHYAMRLIDYSGECSGDWQSMMSVRSAKLNEFHEYSVEWLGNDLVYRLDGQEVYRDIDQANRINEPMFAILNFAKINSSPMTSTWTMEVDWVKHECLVSECNAN